MKEIVERDGWGRYGGRGLISEGIFGILDFGNNFIGDVVAVGIDQDGDVVAVILDKFHKNHLNSLCEWVPGYYQALQPLGWPEAQRKESKTMTVRLPGARTGGATSC